MSYCARCPAHHVVQRLCREAAPGRPGIFDEGGFQRRRVHLVDLVPDDRLEFFDGRQVCALARSSALRPKVREVDLAPTLVLGGGVSYGFVLLKNGRCAVGGMFSVRCLVADAAVPYSTSST